MSNAKEESAGVAGPADCQLIRWRAWPCASCRGGAAAEDFLVRCFSSSPDLPEGEGNELIDWFKKWEAARLLEWIGGCEHTLWEEMRLPRLAEGSEHLVLLDETGGEVVKVTLPGTYGDYYDLINGKIHQFDSTPLEYLLRMRWWEELFSLAPNPIGMTETGQIVSRQRFIQGDANPPQEEVDRFLIESGAIEVRRHCWLWKYVYREAEAEIWVGDARSDNFVLTRDGMVPIDLRIWRVPISVKPSKD